MVKDVSEKLNKKYDSKIAWNAADYIKYKQQVESARIEHLYGLINEFNYWSILSKEEEDNINKIIEDIKNYLNLLYEINAELKNYLNDLEEE